MMRMSFLILAVVLIGLNGMVDAQSSTSAPSTKPSVDIVIPPARDSFDIYLLMGQSNMVGRDTSTLDSQVEHPHVLSLNSDGQWVKAKDPLHSDARIAPGAGMGIPFAVEMLKSNPGRTIGLVPCAVGGTPLSRWVKGADLYEQALRRAKIAAQAGVIQGMLWHQGESDTNTAENADTYQTRLSQMFKDLRTDLGAARLPIIVGQLGDFLTVEKYPFVKTVRSAIQQIPTVIPDAAYADSAGLKDKGDSLHFSAAAQAEFGLRYARAMQKIQK